MDEKRHTPRLQELFDRFSYRVGLHKPNAFRRTDWDLWQSNVNDLRESYRSLCEAFNRFMEEICYSESHPEYFGIFSLMTQAHDIYQDYENTLKAYAKSTVHVGANVSEADLDASGQTQLSDYTSFPQK